MAKPNDPKAAPAKECEEDERVEPALRTVLDTVLSPDPETALRWLKQIRQPESE